MQVEITDLARMCQGADCYVVAHDDLMTTRIAKSISTLKQETLEFIIKIKILAFC